MAVYYGICNTILIKTVMFLAYYCACLQQCNYIIYKLEWTLRTHACIQHLKLYIETKYCDRHTLHCIQAEAQLPGTLARALLTRVSMSCSRTWMLLNWQLHALHWASLELWADVVDTSVKRSTARILCKDMSADPISIATPLPGQSQDLYTLIPIQAGTL